MIKRTWLKVVGAALIACTVSVFAAEPAPVQAPAPLTVKGNPNSKVYHKAKCRHYNAKGSTKVFKTEADAVKAGYKPCKQCAVPGKKSPEKTTGKQNTAEKEKKTEAPANNQ